MAPPVPRPGCLARSFDFQGYAKGRRTSKDAVKATTVHDDDVIMDDSPQSFHTHVNQEAHGTLVRTENNMSTVIDLTGADDVVEGSMRRFTFPVYCESRPSAETFRSAVRALGRTSSHNIASIVKRFAPSSAGNKDSFIVEVSLDLLLSVLFTFTPVSNR